MTDEIEIPHDIFIHFCRGKCRTWIEEVEQSTDDEWGVSPFPFYFSILSIGVSRSDYR